MRREFIENLEKWRISRKRKPLVLSGARQVGKTWLLKEFGKTRFKSLAYVSFDKSEAAHDIFSEGFELKTILTKLQALTGVRIAPGDTLVVFDEIQLCPNALKCLKYWQEDAPEYHVAAAGSLVGLALAAGTGYPVGKTVPMTLYPMDFTEFLDATGDGGIAELLRKEDLSLCSAFHDVLVGRLKDYLFVGGMPDAVDAFASTRSYAEAREVHENILTDYERDFAKHAPKSQVPRIRALWQSLPRQLAKADKRFVAAEVIGENGAKCRGRDLRDPFEWLEAAGLAYRVWNVSKPAIPLESYRNHLFKLFGVDVGLLGAQSHLSAKSVVEGSRLYTEFKGALTEQFVQQELRAAGSMNPFFWSAANSRSEIDFLVEDDDGPVPIEVKAEVNLRAKSLRMFRDRFLPRVAVRTSLAGFKRQEGLINVPLYAIGALRRIWSDNVPNG